MTEYTAHVEHVASILRVFEPGSQYGDPYVFTCTLRWIDQKNVELCGVQNAPLPMYFRAIRDVLREHGVERVTIKHKGRVRVFKVKAN